MKHKRQLFLTLLLTLCLILTGCGVSADSGGSSSSEVRTSCADQQTKEPSPSGIQSKALPSPEASEALTAYSGPADSGIPAYSGETYAVLNDNLPAFGDSELTAEAFESYGELDSLGRCTAACACLGRELMPTEKRGDISQIKPTGWQSIRYDFVDGESLYNRCHLIGFQLSGENANEKNLITGTRYMNVEGMLPFENMVADYIKETDNHVLYRVTPLFDGEDLVAQGVQMEARSVEDGGEGILFNVFCYNVQPGVTICYADGTAALSGEALSGSSAGARAVPGEKAPAAKNADDAETNGCREYILNTNTRKFHDPSCSSAGQIALANKEEFYGTRSRLIEEGWSPCGRCNP